MKAHQEFMQTASADNILQVAIPDDRQRKDVNAQ